MDEHLDQNEFISAERVRETTRITQALIDAVDAAAERCDARAVFVYVNALGNTLLPVSNGTAEKVIYISRTEQEKTGPFQACRVIQVPNVPLSRSGQARLAIFLAQSRGLVERGDIVIVLVGSADSGTIDSLLVRQVGTDSNRFSPAALQILPPAVQPEVIERVVDIAVELGTEGREGKPVGALFVIGDAERVISMSRQLILNPFRGYDENERNILDSSLQETIKELSTIDGAFVVRDDGVIETCGLYLKTASQEEADLPRGLGARHHAAAGITAITEAVAVTVSESTGTVTVFSQGQIVTEIEKLRQRESH